MPETNVTIEIPIKRYEELLRCEAWVDALEAAGVDNWQGYDSAREFYSTPLICSECEGVQGEEQCFSCKGTGIIDE